MTNEKQIKRPPKLTYADGFNEFAKIITEILNKYAYRQDDSEVARLYVTYQQSIANFRDFCTRDSEADLPNLPTLIGNDWYAGLANLRDSCKQTAKQILKRAADNPDPELLMDFDELELYYDKSSRQIRRLAQKYNLREYADLANKNRIQIYRPDLDKIPEYDRLKARDCASKQKLLAKRKQKQAQKKQISPTSLTQV